MAELFIAIATVAIVYLALRLYDARQDAETRRILRRRGKIKKLAAALKRERAGMFRSH